MKSNNSVKAIIYSKTEFAMVKPRIEFVKTSEVFYLPATKCLIASGHST